MCWRWIWSIHTTVGTKANSFGILSVEIRYYIQFKVENECEHYQLRKKMRNQLMASTFGFRTGPSKQDTCMLESKRQIRVETSIWLVVRMAGTGSW